MSEQNLEHELFEKLMAYDGTMLLHKAAILSAIELYGFQVVRDFDHKLISARTAVELAKEAAATCPHHPCKIRGEN